MSDLTAELKEARKINRYEIERTLNEYLFLSRPQLQAVIQDMNTPMLDLIVCRILANSVLYGDHQGFDFLLNRAIGIASKFADTNPDAPSTVVFVAPDKQKKALTVEVKPEYACTTD